MSLLAPLWLLGLLPWGVVVYWVMQRRRRPTGVPYVPLWRGPYHPPKPTRQFAKPPLALLMVLLALLLALIAAARPAVEDPLGRGGKPIAVVIDRGEGMSVDQGKRLAEAFRELQETLLKAGVSPSQKLELHAVPDAPAKLTDVGGLTKPLPFTLTAADTRAAVSATTARLLAETDGPVVVISDQPLGVRSERVIQLPPLSTPFRDVGISRIAARPTPEGQVMVTLAAHGWGGGRVGVTISSDGVETLTMVDAPPDGQERDVFVDIAKMGATVEARLDVSDDAPADDRTWLVRENASAGIEPRIAVVSAMQRLLDSYAATRPPGEGAGRVVIVGDVSEAGSTPAVVIPSRRDGKSKGGGDLTITPHSITRDADFSAVGDVAVVTDPPAGWSPIVRRGDDVWVAVRDAPARQVWVGFVAPDWARTPQYVVFWASVLDWVGGGGEVAYTASAIGDLGPDWVPVTPPYANVDPKWWPGLFRRADGVQRAVNAGVAVPGPVAETDWRTKLQPLRQGGRIELAPYVLLAALACLLLSAIAWKTPTLTEISGKTTVAADGVLTEARAARAVATRSRLTPPPNPSD